MTRQPALRVGDTVRLLDPRPIVRLDYAQTVDSCREQAGQDPRVREFLSRMGTDPRYGGDLDHWSRERIIGAVAASIMSRHKRRGARRELVHGGPVEELRGVELRIVDRQIRQTGRLTWDEGWYLDTDATHVCYRLGNPRSYSTALGLAEMEARPHWPKTGFWVTREQVERVE